MRSLFRIRSTVIVALGLPGCFAVVDVDRFHTASTAPPDSSARLASAEQYGNLKLSLVGFTPHVSQLVEYRVIDASNFIQSRGIINPLGGPDVTINAPLAIPKLNGPFHLDFWADVTHSGDVYTGIGSVISNDHAWRIDPLEDYPPGSVTPVEGLVQVTFTHNTSFTEINDYPSGTPNPPTDTMLGATIHVIGASAIQGVLIQVRVVDPGANRTVGLYRVPQIAATSFDMTIPGVVEEPNQYDVLVYVDANGNGKYDNPAMGAGDLGWSLLGAADSTGLNVTLDAQSTTGANTDVGEP